MKKKFIQNFQVNGDRYKDGGIKHPLLKQSSLDLLTIETPGLKKHDSFSRWMSKELEEVVDLGIKSTSDAFWSSIETVKVPDGSNVLTNEQLDAYVVSPSLSQDQLFSILDVSPSCAYIGTNTKVRCFALLIPSILTVFMVFTSIDHRLIILVSYILLT